MAGFKYAAPRELDEALQLMASAQQPRPLAGGTDIVDQLKTGRRTADLVIEMKRIPQMQRFDVEADGLHIGAARSCTDIRSHPEVPARYAALYEAAGLIGSVQIQNRAALGGNICNAAPSADTAPALLVLDARAVVASSKGARLVELDRFFKGPGQTILEKGELLTGIFVPTPAARSASTYLRFIPRNEMDIAIAGVGCYLEIESSGLVKRARIALAAVAPTPIRARIAELALEGREISDALIEAAAEAAVSAARPISDVRGSAEYRKDLVRVLTRRTLQACLQRINAGDRAS